MKNSQKALLFIKYWKQVNDNNFVINVYDFCETNKISIETLYKHVFSGHYYAENIYHDYVNNFLTVEKFSEYYNFHIDDAVLFLDTFKKIFIKD